MPLQAIDASRSGASTTLSARRAMPDDSTKHNTKRPRHCIQFLLQRNKTSSCILKRTTYDVKHEGRYSANRDRLSRPLAERRRGIGLDRAKKGSSNRGYTSCPRSLFKSTLPYKRLRKPEKNTGATLATISPCAILLTTNLCARCITERKESLPQ